jgi:hypothetical protein
MWAGVVVIAILFALTFHWLSKEESRQHIRQGLFN